MNTHTGAMETFLFGSDAEGILWMANAAAIRAKAAEISANNPNRMSYPVERIRAVYGDLVKQMRSFVEQFGRNRITSDIRFALNDIEAAMEIETTQWD